MADNTEKKVLISVEVLDNFISAKKNVDKWKKSLKDAEANQDTTAEQYREIAENLAKANNQFKDAKKALESASRAQDILTASQDKANKTIGEMRKELTALRNTPFDNLNPKQIQDVEQAMADLKAEIDDYNDRIKGLDTGEVWNNTAASIEFVSASVSAFSNTLKAFGVESDGVLGQLQEKTTEMIAIVQAMGVVTEYLDKRKGKLLLTNIQTIALNAKEAISNGVLSASNWILAKSVDGASTSLKIFRGALIATGIGAIIVLLGLLISNWGSLVGWFKKGTDGISGFGKALDKTKEIFMGVYEALKNYLLMPFKTLMSVVQKLLEGDFKGAIKAGTDEIKNGLDVVGNYQKGSMEQMARNNEANINKMIEAERKKRAETLLVNADILSNQLEVDKARGVSADELYKREKKIIADRITAYRIQLLDLKDINSEEYKEKKKALDDLEQEQKVKDATEVKRLSDLSKENKKKKQDEYLKQLELDKTYSEARLKAESQYQSDDFLTKQKYAQKLYQLQYDNELKKLETLKQFDKITQFEYKSQLNTLSLQQKEFTNSQIKELNSYYEEQRKSIIGLLEQSTDEQILSVTKKYEEARKQIASMPEPTRMSGGDTDFEKRFTEYKQFMLDKAVYELELEKQKNAEIAELEKNRLDKKLSSDYGDDLTKFTDNEREKLRIETKIQTEGAKKRKEIAEKEYNDNKAILDKQLSEKQIEQDKYDEEIAKGKSKLNQTIYADEAALRNLSNQEIQLNLNKELLQANENADAIYKAKKTALEKERELYKDNADKQLEIAKALADNEKELIEARISTFEEWAGKTMELLSAVSDLASAAEEAELQRYEETNEKKKASLEDRLNSGSISQTEYNKQVEKADKDLDKKKAEIARQQAIRDKALKVFGVVTSTIQSIAESAKMGFPAAIPFVAMAAALGAVQTATILATPLPKAKRGMLLRGNSHENGGIQLEAEGGETIINKRSSKMFLPILSAINEAGGGVPFMGSYGDGGYVTRTVINGGYDDEKIASILASEIAKQKIYVAISEVREADKKYTELTEINTSL